MIVPGLVSVTFRSLNPTQIVDLCAKAGLAAIEWGGDVHVPAGDLDTAKHVGDQTRQAGLQVASYGSYFRADENERFEQVVETAVALGAPNIRVWAGKRGSSHSDAAIRQRVVENLTKACEAASKASLTVSAEYHGGTLTDTLDSALKLVREVPLPNFRLYWQPVPERSHAERLAELRSIIPFLSNIHVFQWSKEADCVKSHPLMEGAKEWSDYLAAVAGHRFALLEFLPQETAQDLLDESRTLLGLISKEQA